MLLFRNYLYLCAQFKYLLLRDLDFLIITNYQNNEKDSVNMLFWLACF